MITCVWQKLGTPALNFVMKVTYIIKLTEIIFLIEGLLFLYKSFMFSVFNVYCFCINVNCFCINVYRYCTTVWHTLMYKCVSLVSINVPPCFCFVCTGVWVYISCSVDVFMPVAVAVFFLLSSTQKSIASLRHFICLASLLQTDLELQVQWHSEKLFDLNQN